MKRIYTDDDGYEIIEVILNMRKVNFDALVKADEERIYIPVNGMAIAFDEDEANPVARLMHSSSPAQKEEQRSLGFVGVPRVRP